MLQNPDDLKTMIQAIERAYERAVRANLTSESCGLGEFHGVAEEYGEGLTVFVSAVEGTYMLVHLLNESGRSVHDPLEEGHVVAEVAIPVEGVVGSVVEGTTPEAMAVYVQEALAADSPNDLYEYIHERGLDLAAEYLHLLIRVVAELVVEKAAATFVYPVEVGSLRDDVTDGRWN